MRLSQYIGPAIRYHRQQDGLTQRDMENLTGLLRCYLSRVENGHTIPSLDTLETIGNVLNGGLTGLLHSADVYRLEAEGTPEVTVNA